MFYYKIAVESSSIPFVSFGEKEMTVLKIVWVIVCLGMLLYMRHSHLKQKFLRHKACISYYRVIKPRIYRPAEMKEEFYELERPKPC